MRGAYIKLFVLPVQKTFIFFFVHQCLEPLKLCQLSHRQTLVLGCGVCQTTIQITKPQQRNSQTQVSRLPARNSVQIPLVQSASDITISCIQDKADQVSQSKIWFVQMQFKGMKWGHRPVWHQIPEGGLPCFLCNS